MVNFLIRIELVAGEFVSKAHQGLGQIFRWGGWRCVGVSAGSLRGCFYRRKGVLDLGKTSHEMAGLQGFVKNDHIGMIFQQGEGGAGQDRGAEGQSAFEAVGPIRGSGTFQLFLGQEPEGEFPLSDGR